MIQTQAFPPRLHYSAEIGDKKHVLLNLKCALSHKMNKLSLTKKTKQIQNNSNMLEASKSKFEQKYPPKCSGQFWGYDILMRRLQSIEINYFVMSSRMSILTLFIKIIINPFLCVSDFEANMHFQPDSLDLHVKAFGKTCSMATIKKILIERILKKYFSIKSISQDCVLRFAITSMSRHENTYLDSAE